MNWLKLLRVAAVVAASLVTFGAQADSLPSRWASEFADFARADATRHPAPGGVVFVGSSSIRLWDRLEDAFDRFPLVLKRGFGGSTAADCVEHVQQLVTAYRPRLVVLYAGENDLAEGATAAAVAERVHAFTQRVWREQPDTVIAYVSIKPSPSRADLLPAIQDANARIRSDLEKMPNARFIDVYSPMLDSNGRPRAELYGPDRLHMNAAGYALWRREISSRLP